MHFLLLRCYYLGNEVGMELKLSNYDRIVIYIYIYIYIYLIGKYRFASFLNLFQSLSLFSSAFNSGYGGKSRSRLKVMLRCIDTVNRSESECSIQKSKSTIWIPLCLRRKINIRWRIASTIFILKLYYHSMTEDI